MKIYVTRFKPKPETSEDNELTKTGKPVFFDPETHDIFYHVKPYWTFDYKELGETELRILQSMNSMLVLTTASWN